MNNFKPARQIDKVIELTRAERWTLAEQLAAERLPLINEGFRSVTPSNTIYARYIKRVLDIVISLIVLILTFPINLIVGVITLLDVGFPMFFKQRRVGKDGNTFQLIKFRNMTNETDNFGDLLPPAARVTRFGAFVRKTSLDELLNFWSILKGDMSLIGPRPLVPEYSIRYNNRHWMRLAVRPGLECPPRRRNVSRWSWQDQFENDVWYVENVSFKTDCQMLIRLIKFALDRKSANDRAFASRGIFMGYTPAGMAINLDEVPLKYKQEIRNNRTKACLAESVVSHDRCSERFSA